MPMSPPTVRASVDGAEQVVMGIPVDNFPTQQIPIAAQNVLHGNQQAFRRLEPFHTGLMHCMDDSPSCLEAFFLPWCQNSRQYNVFAYGRTEIDPLSCIVPMVIDCLWLPATPFMTCHLRQKVRHRYALSGDEVSDFVSAFFCLPCSIAQHHREMSLHGDCPRGFCVNVPFSGVSRNLQEMA
mgnify:FL=1